LQGARIVPRVGQRVAAGVPQHVRMGLEPKARRQRCPLHHPGKSGSRERRAPFAYEHEWAGLALPLKPAKGSHFRSAQRVHTRGASLDPTDVQDRAIEIHLIPTKVNGLQGVRVVGRRDEGSKKIVPPSKEAMRRLIEVADKDFRVQLVVATATGIRAGEFHALRWRHIDFAKGEVKIETRVDAHGEEDVTKTAAGMRDIPLAVPVVTALKEWKLRTKRKKAQDLVFPSKRGTYAGHDNMVKWKFAPLLRS
jgi:integrase